MSQTSPAQLTKDVQERIEDVFFKALVDIKSTEQARNFFRTFFTPTEQVNLPKRLAIFIMLAKNSEYLEIRDKLKVSVSTVASVRKKLLVLGLKGLNKFIDRILQNDLTNVEYDPDPKWARGKRYHRNKAKQKPYRHLPF